MERYEIEALIENRWRKNRESWEQARILGYVTAQCQFTKPLNPKDILTFPWEKMEVVQDTQEERDALFKEMKEMEKMLNTKK